MGDFLRVSILDNGKGIKDSDKEKIFDAGFTTKDKGKGTGLGLAICKKIIEKHRGELHFESGKLDYEKGYKTIFRIDIPLF